ncbi:MAG: hypothetical protein ACHRHE_16995 [Tepidisphaerales bacterium]
MPLIDLSPVEQQVVHECLRASVTGPFFPMCEFSTLFGLTHQQVADIAFSAPPIDDSREDVRIAINNALNMLTGYPIKSKDVWGEYISVPPAEVRRILKKWKGTPTESPFARDVFDEMM